MKSKLLDRQSKRSAKQDVASELVIRREFSPGIVIYFIREYIAIQMPFKRNKEHVARSSVQDFQFSYFSEFRNWSHVFHSDLVNVF